MNCNGCGVRCMRGWMRFHGDLPCVFQTWMHQRPGNGLGSAKGKASLRLTAARHRSLQAAGGVATGPPNILP